MVAPSRQATHHASHDWEWTEIQRVEDVHRNGRLRPFAQLRWSRFSCQENRKIRDEHRDAKKDRARGCAEEVALRRAGR